MRPLRYFALIVVILAACSTPPPTPTATPVPPTATPIPGPTATPTAVEQQLVLTVPVPVAGTLIPRDFNATSAPNLNYEFASIAYTQNGSQMALVILVTADGTVERELNGVKTTSRISPEQVAQVNEQLRRINFYGLQGQFTGASGQANAFSYSLTVSSEQMGDRTIFAQDGLTPRELLSLFALIRDLGA